MDIFLTFDYELFFGERTGSVQKCMIDPTDKLLKIAIDNEVQMTFFVDIGHIIAIERWKEQFPELQSDFDLIVNQLKRIEKANCSIQLHIHPHWEKASYSNLGWEIDTTNCYKLGDFSENERTRIVKAYKARLDDLIEVATTTFRAGGWCIQPFSQLKEVFKSVGIKRDSTVFTNGKFSSKDYYFDFTTAPKKSRYCFEDDVCKEDESGYFEEFPISSYRYTPLFYWRLYLLGRLFPASHKMVGDGSFLAQPGRKKSVLLNYTWNHASSDGYYMFKLPTIFREKLRNGDTEMVVIGHPKGNTIYSMNKLEKFVSKQAKSHQFKAF